MVGAVKGDENSLEDRKQVKLSSVVCVCVYELDFKFLQQTVLFKAMSGGKEIIAYFMSMNIGVRIMQQIGL